MEVLLDCSVCVLLGIRTVIIDAGLLPMLHQDWILLTKLLHPEGVHQMALVASLGREELNGTARAKRDLAMERWVSLWHLAIWVLIIKSVLAILERGLLLEYR